MLERFSIRWRLALISSALTFLILCGFALVIGQLTVNKVRANFDNATANAASQLSQRLRIVVQSTNSISISPDIDLYAASNDAEIRLFNGNKVLVKTTKGSPDFGPPRRDGGHRGAEIGHVQTAAQVVGEGRLEEIDDQRLALLLDVDADLVAR